MAKLATNAWYVQPPSLVVSASHAWPRRRAISCGSLQAQLQPELSNSEFKAWCSSAEELPPNWLTMAGTAKGAASSARAAAPTLTVVDIGG